METISITKLKANLSREIKKVQKGARIIVLEHNHPVAELAPIGEEESLFVREAIAPYHCEAVVPLTQTDPSDALAEERDERC